MSVLSEKACALRRKRLESASDLQMQCVMWDDASRQEPGVRYMYGCCRVAPQGCPTESGYPVVQD